MLSKAVSGPAECFQDRRKGPFSECLPRAGGHLGGPLMSTTAGPVVTFILQMRKWHLREVIFLAQGHRAAPEWDWDRDSETSEARGQEGNAG